MESLVLTKGTTYVYNGKCYKFNRKKNGKSFFKCKLPNCSGSATEYLDVVHDRPHTCCMEPDRIESLRALSRYIVKARTSQCAIPDLASDLLSTVSESVAGHLGSTKSLQMRFYRAQRQNIPKIPTTCQFEIPPSFQMTARNTNFLLADISNLDSRMLIFGSAEDLKCLSKSCLLYTSPSPRD